MAVELFEVVLLAMVVLLVVVDILSTYVAVALLGFREGNPVMGYLISRYGFAAAFSLSLAVVALTVFTIAVLSPNVLRIVLAAVAASYSVVVAFNVIQIFIRIGLEMWRRS
jgi:MFS family permease